MNEFEERVAAGFSDISATDISTTYHVFPSEKVPPVGAKSDVDNELDRFASEIISLNKYKKFNQVNIDEMINGITGYITTNSTELLVYIPLALHPDTKYIGIDIFKASLRHVHGGYVGGTNLVNLTSYVTEVAPCPAQNLIAAKFVNSEGWGITNNTPVVGYAIMTYVVYDN